jgi:prepilin-type N-terminal cleavage/methylation domain-containing protein
MNFNFFSKNKEKGMTFIEVVVVMGIFATISATVIFNYRDFSSGVKLQNLSQEIALQARRAQTYASQGVRPMLPDPINNLLPFDWVSSYGLAFLKDVEGGEKSFVFYFNDFNPNENMSGRDLFFDDYVLSGGYDNFSCGLATGSECLEKINITDGSYIDLICPNFEPNPEDIASCGEGANDLHISYTRPFLEAYILSGDDNYESPLSYAFIRISSADGEQKRYITFWATGQVEVN